MKNLKKVSGSCLCGVVTLTAESVKKEVGVCHCGMCRKWSAGPFFAVDCGPEVSIDGQEHVSIYDSSEWAERAFCKKCGTHLFYRLKKNNQHMISPEFLNDGEFHLNHQIFIDDKARLL